MLGGADDVDEEQTTQLSVELVVRSTTAAPDGADGEGKQ